MIINKNWKIESDTLNVTLFYKNDGTKTWRPIYYFSSPQNALEGLIKLEIMGDGLKDFKTVCEKLDKLYDLVQTLKGMPDLLESAPRYAKEKSNGNGWAGVEKKRKNNKKEAGQPSLI